MATIGHLPETLADRCIIIGMERKLPSETCEPLREFDATVYRRECARFVLDNAAAIASAHPALPENLNDRAGDIWEPLLALADLAGGEWPTKAREAARGLSARAQESDPMGALLFDILNVFLTAEGKRISTRRMVRELLDFTDRPWGDTLKERGLNERWLARQLRAYGIRPRLLRVEGGVMRGYVLDDFVEVFRRYIPRAELEALEERLKKEQAARDERET
jgi:putative DNA primase/helicase